MKTWTNNDFKAGYIGGTAVVVAESPERAAALLNAELLALGLEQTAEAKQFVHLPTSKPIAVVLNNGDY
jgi:hypothetical protein